MTSSTIQKVDSLPSQMSNAAIDLDVILTEVGTFGKYQMVSFTFICIPIMFNAVFTLGYIFTAGNPDYRCEIPQCENNTAVSKERWLQYVLPFEDGDNTRQRCHRYAYTAETGTCEPRSFNKSHVVECDSLVYETDERTITSEWNLTCEKNQWKLSLVGTINNIGQFFCLPLTGFVSDNYGRRTALVIALVFGGIFGILRSFSLNYGMFLVTEFLDPLFSAGCYTSAFVLGMEFLGPKHRVLGGCIISCFYAVGGIMIGTVGYFFPYWRHFLLILYAPCLLGFLYLFFLPESVRWLMTQGRYAEVAKIVQKVAKVNGKQLSEVSLAQLENSKAEEKAKQKEEKNAGPKYPVMAAFKSTKLVIRLAVCSFCWLTNTFVYYGLNLSAVSLDGNKYFNFIFSNVIEIPAHILALFMVNKIGRRWSMCGSLILAGFSCIAMEFIPEAETNVKFYTYLVGKFAISISFTIVYVYTAELFPTSLRNSLLGICSMFGRFGSISAPQTPLLAIYFPSLPYLLFGGTSMLAGVFSLTFPETLNTKLPDTIEEAVKIGTDPEPKLPE